MKNFSLTSKNAISLAILTGLTSSSVADARLIFTTEEDGTPAASWTIDQGDIYNDVDLNFGTTGVGINYNFTNGYFTFSDEVQMQVQNNAGVPNSCTATESGQMYFDTGTELLYFCNGSAWTTTNSAPTIALNDGEFLVGNASNVATAVTATGDVTFNNTGVFDITANAVTSAEILDDTVTSADILDGTIATVDVADDAITLGKIANGPASQILTTDASGNPAWESRLNFVSSTLNDGEFLVGNASNVATAVTATGDVTFNNAGVFDITANAVTSAEILDDTVTSADILDDTITFDDIATREASTTESPEFSNFTLQAPGSNRRGTLESDYDTTANKNYYKWSTRQSLAAQEYDIVMQWAIPEEFQGFSTTASAPIEIDYKTNTTTANENALTITLEDSTGNPIALTSATNLTSTTADTWVEDAPLAFSGGTFTPGEYLTIRFSMKSQASSPLNQNPVFLGPIKFNYTAK